LALCRHEVLGGALFAVTVNRLRLMKLRLKVHTLAVAFPITVARRFGSARSAMLDRLFAGGLTFGTRRGVHGVLLIGRGRTGAGFMFGHWAVLFAGAQFSRLAEPL